MTTELRIVIVVLLVCSVATPALAYQSPEAVVIAMDIDMSLVVSGSIATPDGPASHPGPTGPQMFDVRSSLGVVSPYNAPSMGLLFTGNVDNIIEDYDYLGDGRAGDYVTLTFDIEVPILANSFSFNFNFLSREFPARVGASVTDTFVVFSTSNAYMGQIVFDAFGNLVTVQNALFVIDGSNDPNLLVGTGFDQNGATGWLTTIAPCDPGEIMTLSFEIYDGADGTLDSGVLLDNFSFWEAEIPTDWPFHWTGEGFPDQWTGDDDFSDDDDSAGDDDDSAGDDDDSAGDDDDSTGDDDDATDDDDSLEEEREGDDVGECEDGADNDFDGDFDCNDSDCSGAPVCTESDESAGSCDCSTSGAGRSSVGILFLFVGAVLRSRRRLPQQS